MEMKNCWEILQCGREPRGSKSAQLGVCIGAEQEMGHSCWAIAGTLCGGKVQGSWAQKESSCTNCEVYKKYHRFIGSHGKEIPKLYPDEQEKYLNLWKNRIRESVQKNPVKK